VVDRRDLVADEVGRREHAEHDDPSRAAQVVERRGQVHHVEPVEQRSG
jgi:hypothetical protein